MHSRKTQALFPEGRVCWGTTVGQSTRWLASLLVLLLAGACSSTKIKSSVNPRAALTPPIRNIMVVAKDERPDVRSEFENDMVNALLKHQVTGVASYQQFPLDDLTGDKEQLKQKFANTGAQSVLIVRLVERGTFMSGPPGTIGDISPGSVDEASYERFTSGGDIETDLRLGAKLYRVSDGSMVWSGVIDTTLKEDYDSIVVMRSVADRIVSGLAKDKVIP